MQCTIDLSRVQMSFLDPKFQEQGLTARLETVGKKHSYVQKKSELLSPTTDIGQRFLEGKIHLRQGHCIQKAEEDQKNHN